MSFILLESSLIHCEFIVAKSDKEFVVNTDLKGHQTLDSHYITEVNLSLFEGDWVGDVLLGYLGSSINKSNNLINAI
jgi:hypothetical protein